MEYLKCYEKCKIAFAFQVPSFWVSWESLYESCIADERFDVRLFWLNISVGDKAQMESAENFLEDKEIPYEIFSYENILRFSPHYMVYQTPYDYGHRTPDMWTIRYKRLGIRIVYIPYGIEISDTKESRAKHFSLSTVSNAFLVFTLSEAMKNEYDKYCMNANAVRAVGLPRFDSLLKQFPFPEKLKASVGNRKIILWKVHFPKFFLENGVKKQVTPDLGEYLKFIEYVAANQDIFFIFMPHPKFVDNTISEESRFEGLGILKALSQLSNVYIDQDDDYRRSLVHANAIIVDRSAVMVEAGMKGVPVLYMHHQDYMEPMTPPIQKLLDSYYQGTTAADMITFCNKVRENKDEQREQRLDAFRKCVPFCDGCCAERVKNELWKGAHKEAGFEMLKTIKTGARIVIFGTGNMGYVCMEAYQEKGNGKFEIVSFLDNDYKKHGNYVFGREISAANSIVYMNYDYIVIATDKYYRQVYNQLTEEYGIPKEKIISYDEFVVILLFG